MSHRSRQLKGFVKKKCKVILTISEIHSVIRYVYDKACRLSERREVLDSGLDPVAGEHKITITVYGYDENGNRTLLQTPEGYRILREYDSLDRMIAEHERNELKTVRMEEW